MKDKLTLRLEEAWNVMESTSKLPPGFSADDIYELNDLVNGDVEDSINEDEKTGDFDFENIINAKVDVAKAKQDGINPIDVLKAIQYVSRVNIQGKKKPELYSKESPEYKKAKELVANYAVQEKGAVGLRRARDIHNTNLIKYVDYNIVDGTFNFDKLKQQALIPPKNLLKQNDKMLHSGGGEFIFYDTKVAAYRGLFFNKSLDKFQFVNTCPNAGSCLKDCYASKGNEIKFPASNLNSIRTLTLLLNDYFEFRERFLSEVQKASGARKATGKQIVVRWHSAGDFFNPKYFDVAIDIAKASPDIDFYAYTKQISLYLNKKESIPSNLEFILSEGGKEDMLTRKLMAEDPSLKKSIIVPNPDSESGEWDSNELKANMQTPEYQNKLKDLVSTKYKLNKEKVIFYNELIQIPYNKENIPSEKYKVIVLPIGDGDTAAYRRDVDVVLLFKH